MSPLIIAIVGYSVGLFLFGFFLGSAPWRTIQVGDIVVNTSAGEDAKEIAQQIRREIRRGTAKL